VRSCHSGGVTARRPVISLVVALVVLPAAAEAQTQPAPPPAPSPVAAPAPAPVAAEAVLRTAGGLATGKARYYAPHQQVVLSGRVKPAVPGELITLHALRGGKASRRIQRTVRSGGRFQFRFKVGKPGLLRLVVTHAASDEQLAFRARAKRVRVVRWRAGVGARGVRVLLLQRALKRLGFATPVSGRFDGLTANAVNAFRKTNRMGVGGYADAAVYAMLHRREGAFELRHPRAGKHVEFDWSRQVLVLARRGRPYRVYHTSSGTPATPTVFGSFRFYRKTPGTNALGMVHSSYFIRGYAIHGYASVPNYPASHGCLRVPVPNAASIYRWIDIGDPIYSYR
jgi:L,D-transpeptidase catalytic domain/Putative peptidoglycan binding domain